ncbi:MAG TPA: AMP-binding protein, partial [Streptosporangiaceae bacterium]|nr:AMP-binding protein [Streptosporangiaceae bacterium]
MEELICRVFADVLGLDLVGPDDDFFTLGGHSLLAVTLTDMLRQRGIPVSVQALFQAPTPAGLALTARPALVVVPPNRIPAGATRITPAMLPLADLTQDEIDRVTALADGGAGNIADIYPLAPLQEGMFFHHLVAASGDVYVLPVALRFGTRTRLDEFVGALREVIGRHDIYRTSIAWEGLREPVQVVWRQAELPVADVTLPGGPDPVGALLSAVEQGGGLDLRRAPLLDLHVAAEPGTSRWLGLLRVHHLLLDHTGLNVLLAEMRALLDSTPSRLPVPVPFREFVARARLGVLAEEHERFFAGLVGDVSEPTAPFGLLDVRGGGGVVSQARAEFGAGLAGRLREAARAVGVSPATVFHLVWARVLAAVSGRDDVVFGTVLSGRMNAGAVWDQVPGPLINTLPVRVRVGVAAAEAVAGMQAQLAGLLVHEHAPLTVAQQASGVAAPAPLFTSLFNYRHDPGPDAMASAGLDGIDILAVSERSNYPITVSVDDTGTGFAVTVLAAAPADAAQICQLVQTAAAGLVTVLADAAGAALGQVPVLGEDGLRQLLAEWNDTTRPGAAVTVPELVERQVDRSPDAIALVSEDAVLTYAELDAAASGLAARLASLGATSEQVVAVVMERSSWLVVTLLAVMKAGAAYLPVDPGYPADLIAFMLADSDPAAIVTDVASAPLLAESVVAGAPVLIVGQTGLDDSAVVSNDRRVSPAAAAYVMYTSGSTGRPKGVAVPHQAIDRLVRECGFADLGSGDVVAQMAPVSFDAATFEIWGALASGAVLALGP